MIINVKTGFRAAVGVIPLLVATMLWGANAAARGDEAGTAVRRAVAKVAPSVVRIRTIGGSGAADLAISSQVTTGVVISSDGYVLTSAFGLSKLAAAVFVEDSAGNRVAAKLVATDHVRKLVLLKCERGTFVTPAFVQGRWPDVGATSIAVGRMYPGTDPSVSVGIVSAVNRIFGLAVQTDAKISPVNYGGPLIDLDGNVLGILVPLSPQDQGEDVEAGVEWYDSGIGFAIPASDALQSANILRQGTDRVRGVMGIGLSTRNPLATAFKVTVVHPDSPASKANLEVGDVIVSVDDTSIDRFGILESIVKSSYAGDRVRMKVKRGDETLEKELILIDQLVRPVTGYVGMLPLDVVKDEEENVLGVQIRVLPDTPLMQAGLPDSAILSKWNDDTIASLSDLAKSLRTAVAGQSVELTWRESPASPTENRDAVVPVLRPDTVTRLPDPVVADIVGSSDSVRWTRGEKDVAETGGKVWFYAPENSIDVQFGMVVLLSAGDEPQEVILNRWKDLCELHNLILVVPTSAEKTGLTREHRELIQQAAAVAAATTEGRRVEAARAVLVASSEQAEVCTELLLQLRRRQFRAATFIDAWPQVSGVSPEVLAATSPSSLILSGDILSRQRQALQQQAVSTLRKSGVWTVQQTYAGDDDPSVEQLIADWILFLKSR